MKTKILIMGGSLSVGGVEKSLISLLQSINYEQYSVDLILKSEGMLKTYIPEHVNIISPPKYYKWIFIPKENLISALISSIGINMNIFRLLYYLFLGMKNNNMTVARQKLQKSSMHTLSNFYGEYDIGIDYTGGLKSILIGKVNAKKKLTWIHSDYNVYRRDKILDMDDYSSVDAILSVSKTCNDIFVSEFPQYSKKCHIMPNISNKQQIANMATEHVEFDSNFKGVKILDITRLDPNKGLDIAVKACRHLIDKGHDLRWYILGDGPERLKIEKLIKHYNLEKRFFLLGVRANPYPFIKKADIIVHCSLFEGRSVAIDEAMLLGKPIIVTDYPTARDQIQDRENGLVCEISVEGVSNAIEILIEDEELKEHLAIKLSEFDISSSHSLGVLEDIFNE